MHITDVLIIGSEGAGARAAIAAACNGASVTIVTKGRMGKSGATLTASADISVDSYNIKHKLGLEGDTADSPEIFFEDILSSGQYINNYRLVEEHVEKAPSRVKEMMDWGMKVRGVLHCPGHRYPRGIYTTGGEIVRTLKKRMQNYTITVIEDTMVLDLLKSKGRVIGALGLDLRSGEVAVFRAKSIVIASGGGAMLYSHQTTPEELTGDGYAVCLRAGARLVDIEMIQFMPYCLLEPSAFRGNNILYNVIAENTNFLNGWLLNRHGERFMKKWDPKRMERSTRDRVSLAIATEVKEGRGTQRGGVYLSFAHLPRNLLKEFPKWALKPLLKENWNYAGLDMSWIGKKIELGEAVEVGIAAHFFVGGVEIDNRCRTSLSGLFAAGEVTGGFHGANRLSGNACLEVLVEGEIAGREAALYSKKNELVEIDDYEVYHSIGYYYSLLNKKNGVSPFEIKKRIQQLSWEKVGVIRTGDDLEKALKFLEEIKTQQQDTACSSNDGVYNREWVEALQNRNRLLLLEAIIRSALVREESRGVHFRTDWPGKRDEFKCNLITEKSGSKMKVLKIK